MPETSVPPNQFRTRASAVIRLARLSILPGGILAYALGSALAFARLGSFDWGAFWLGLALTELANLAAHFADEYADLDTDTLTRRTWFSGGSGVLPEGILPPSTALKLGILFALFALAGSAVSAAAGWISLPAFGILLFGLIGGWFYSMPPLRLERRGLAEITNAFIGGLLMPLMGFSVQTGSPDPEAIAALMPPFLAVLANLLAVHWQDRKADTAVAKRTLVVLLGPLVPWLYAVLTVLGCLAALVLYPVILPLPVLLAVFAALPFSLWTLIGFSRNQPAVPGSLAMGAVLLFATIGWFLS